ncbi:N-acyl-D-amino-acid deacylase family protein [Nocardia jiangxiensis]|uniref:N-acyl-D-amino-acid deacylase family protein n=1 Tax=Nocardia jiangxiensis TaxID=282685 RepID=UPI0002D4D576|nr:amidohydrolase family protein [Nocardia jiangxiensis]
MTEVDSAYDLVIRGGRIVDGTGSEPFVADIAVRQGRIAAVGPDLGPSVEEFDATGLLVTPGFVDIHTHYDGQVTWENALSPSSNHGVTTIVTGNCGVGFAPCREQDHEELVDLMAGVEDIPEVVMTEGLAWNWETFPEYLDVVDSRPHDADIAAMLPHSALRVYVMGDRAVRREPANADDIAQMARLTTEALEAGAIGFGTSRAIQQKSFAGVPIPTVGAGEDELRGILGAMADKGSGVFQALSDFDTFRDVAGEFGMFRRLVSETGRPMSFTLNQKHDDPDGWRALLDMTEQANRDGLPIKGQVLGRPTGMLMGNDVSVSPFSTSPTYVALAALPWDARIGQMRTPAVKDKILAECVPAKPGSWERRFELTDPPNYEPDPDRSIAARAEAEGVEPAELAYRIMLENNGRGLIFAAVQNFADGSLDAAYEMMVHPDTVLGLGDGGAHCGLICDASYPTSMLTLWTRDRTRGPKLTVPQAVRALSSSTAEAVGLCDRGRIAPGYKADLNVIDYDRLELLAPRVVRDLPAGGRRVVQEARGYVATFVSGVATRRDGRPTGALPGRVVRGSQVQPA